MKILIVDDESLARERLEELVMDIYTDAEINEAKNGLEALELISNVRPDIVLLDIRMPGMDGLELANHLLQFENPPAVVFTTAYQDHALKAFDANAVDYLLKPIRKERLETALERASVVSAAKLSEVISDDEPARSHLSAMIKGDLQLIPIEDIYFFKAEQKYVSAVWPGGEMLIDEPLVSLETEFAKTFIRIHRNALVAINQIESLNKNNEGGFVIKLREIKEPLGVSRRHLSEVRNLLKQT